MLVVKRIVCLANSRKYGGTCVAGKEFSANGGVGKWIRPVSDRKSAEVSLAEQRYEDGDTPQLLDVVEVPLLRPEPIMHQQENWLLDKRQRWTKAGRVDWAGIERLMDPLSPLWVNGHSTIRGANDRMPLEITRNVGSSLRLIRVEGMEVVVSSYGERPHAQGRFRHNGDDYWLRITDLACEEAYLRRPDGVYHIGGCYLTISLGEPFENPNTGSQDCYKLIGAVFTEEMLS